MFCRSRWLIGVLFGLYQISFNSCNFSTSQVAGPTKPRPFIDDIYVSVNNIDPLFLDESSVYVPVVICFGATRHSFDTLQFSHIDGIAMFRITPPPVNTATRMVFITYFQNSRSLVFVPRMNVSFMYEAFDTPSLADMFSERATIDAITIVEFQLSSASVGHANIFFGSKTVLSILNSQDNGNSAIRAEVPGFSLHEASSCVPPAPSCSSLVNVTISVMLNDYAVAMFFRPFELLLPEQPQVDAIGSLVVDINNPTTLNFSISHPKHIDKVVIGNTSCPLVISPRSSMPIASARIAANIFSLSSPNAVFRSRVDPGWSQFAI